MTTGEAMNKALKDAAARAAERIEKLFYGHHGYQRVIVAVIEQEWQRAQAEAARLVENAA